MMRAQPVDLTVAIVTFNSRAVIGACLAGLGGVAAEVLVIDNASADDTAEIVTEHARQHPGDRVRLIRNAANLGYGRAANVGLDASRSRYMLLLNPDIRIAPQQLRELRELAPLAAVVAPNVLDESGASQQRLPAIASFDPGSVCEVEWAVGAALLIDRQTAPRFDEKIFLFFEETDFCRRTGRILVAPGIRVRHASGTSSGSSPRVEYLKGWHCAWSRHYYRRKHGLRHSVGLYLAVKCLQWCVSLGSPRKRIKYGSRIAGTVAWLRGVPAFSFTGWSSEAPRADSEGGQIADAA